jgi:C1A family cysteine protease
MMKYKLGLLPSPPDIRDYRLAAFLPSLTVPLPEDCLVWTAYESPVKNQEKVGTCASFAGAGLAEEYNNKEFKTVLDLSEQFLYGEAKKIDGMAEEGTYLRAILAVLKNIGVCEEYFLPYEGKYPPVNTPKPGAYENAAKYKIASYAYVETGKTSMKTAIFLNGPLLIGVKVFDSFMDTGSDGIVTMPSGELQGGHALLVIGYTKLGLLIKNSWTEAWGNNGHAIIPWNVWDAISAGEAWSVVDITTQEPQNSLFTRLCDIISSLFK